MTNQDYEKEPTATEQKNLTGLFRLFSWLDEKNVTRTGIILGTLAFLLPLAVYLKTCMREPGYLTDYIEMSIVAGVWGLPHAPGFPLYILLTGLSGLIPIGTLTFRVAMVSAVSVALMTHLIYRIARILKFGPWLALGTALLVASSYPIWLQAIITDCYGLGLMIMFFTLWSLFKWGESRDQRWFLLTVWSFILNMATHPCTAIMFPGILAYILLTDWRVLVRPATLTSVAAALMVDVALYGYIYWRSLGNPSFNVFMLDGDLGKFFDFITAKEYQHLVGWKPDHASKTVALFTMMARDSLTTIGWYAAWAGILAVIVRFRQRALPLLIIPVTVYAYVYYYHTFEIESRLAPIYPFMVILAATLLVTLVEAVPRGIEAISKSGINYGSGLRKAGYAVIGLVLVLGIARNTVLNLHDLDYSGPVPEHAAAGQIVSAVESPCIILAEHDQQLALQMLYWVLTDPKAAIDGFPFLSDFNQELSDMNITCLWNRELFERALARGMNIYIAGRSTVFNSRDEFRIEPVDTDSGTIDLYRINPDKLG